MTTRGRTAAMLNRQIREAQEKLLLLERMPEEDTYDHGAMIRIVVTPTAGNRDPLTYLLLKTIGPSSPDPRIHRDQRWYFTGRLFQRGGVSQRYPNERGYATWDELMSWLINDVVLESWDELYVDLDQRGDPDEVTSADGTVVMRMNDDRS